ARAPAAPAWPALTASLLTWAGAGSQPAHVSFGRLLEAGANCLPTTFLFLGIAALAFALLPRAATGIAYGLVTLAFVWDLFGSLLGAPKWLLDATPFQRIGLVPSQPFRAADALAMLTIAAISALAGVQLFARRDLAST